MILVTGFNVMCRTHRNRYFPSTFRQFNFQTLNPRLR